MTARMRRRNIARFVCLLFGVVLLLPAAPAHAAATWTKVSSPNRGTIASALQDVAMVPATSTAWAVGYYYDSNLAVYRTMTQRYNGSSWSVVSSPSGSSTGYSQLNKVDATSASSVWAIGYDTVGGGLVERYNGTQWVKMAAPGTVALRGLDVVSSNNVWVAGYSGAQATVAQWTNGSWTTRYTLPAVGRHLSVFEGIAVRAGQVWAVGWDRDYNKSGNPVSSLVVHFDGTTWTRESTPVVDDRDTLMDVVALGNGDVFAVGVAQDTSGGGIQPRALMLRKQVGGSWTSLSVPAADDESQGQLQSVTAVSSSSVWAVGYYYSSASGLYQPLLVHWSANGGAGTLTTHDVSPPLSTSAIAFGVTSNAGGTLWATGYQSTTGGDRTLILRGTGG